MLRFPEKWMSGPYRIGEQGGPVRFLGIDSHKLIALVLGILQPGLDLGQNTGKVARQRAYQRPRGVRQRQRGQRTPVQ